MLNRQKIEIVIIVLVLAGVFSFIDFSITPIQSSANAIDDVSSGIDNILGVQKDKDPENKKEKDEDKEEKGDENEESPLPVSESTPEPEATITPIPAQLAFDLQPVKDAVSEALSRISAPIQSQSFKIAKLASPYSYSFDSLDPRTTKALYILASALALAGWGILKNKN